MLTQEEVLHVAKLARIALTDDEVKKYQKNLSSILSYVDELQEVSIEEGLRFSMGIKNVYRQDKAEDAGDIARDRIKDNFPQKRNDYLEVKSVF